ncbi:hypothetical protein L7F22_004044 [Adiantum nelumboides]|nr:hypothetical protein [Adiantum nelumboides]
MLRTCSPDLLLFLGQRQGMKRYFTGKTIDERRALSDAKKCYICEEEHFANECSQRNSQDKDDKSDCKGKKPKPSAGLVPDLVGARASFISPGLASKLGIRAKEMVKADTGASDPFSKYIKRKKLDPLDTYIPAVLLSKFQFQDLEAKLLSDKPEYSNSRSFLRTGPASSLRSNIRAVAQYASEGGDGKNALEAVRECIVSLEELDSLLLRASRSDSSATIERMKERIDAAVSALDKLLTTVPSPIMERCKAIADSYRETNSLSTTPDAADADTKMLESLL